MTFCLHLTRLVDLRLNQHQQDPLQCLCSQVFNTSPRLGRLFKILLRKSIKVKAGQMVATITTKPLYSKYLGLIQVTAWSSIKHVLPLKSFHANP
nr:hypothetical protein Iba_chr05fCG6690 [Ipomoea batatas]